MDSTPSLPSSCPVPEVFDLPGVTAVGGANLLIDFERRELQLRRHLEALPIRKAEWATTTVGQDLECLIVGYSLGMERISHMDEWEQDPLLRLKLGLQKLPQHCTLYRTLERFDSQQAVASLAKVNRPLVSRLVRRYPNVILDIDTTVETVHGQQEGACVAYNARYRGRRSYQPFVAFEANSRAAVHVALRSGKTPDAKEKVAFYLAAKEQLGRAPDFVRADRAFASEIFCAQLEQDHVGYTLKLRMTSGLWEQIAKGVLWRRLPSDETTQIEVGSVRFQAHGWEKKRRVVLIRTRPADEPQLRLFAEQAWDYEAIVTDQDWNEEDVWHFYNQRCTCENHIKELKHGLRMDAIAKVGFWPNAADLWLKVLAYNVLLAFRQLAPVEIRRYSIERFRRMVLRIPGILVRHARQWRLRLPQWWPHQAAYQHLRAALGGT